MEGARNVVRGTLRYNLFTLASSRQLDGVLIVFYWLFPRSERKDLQGRRLVNVPTPIAYDAVMR